MTRKEAQDFFREHISMLEAIYGMPVWGNKYNARFDEAIEAIMNDDPLEPLPCPFCKKTGITVEEGSSFKWFFGRCNECGATCGEIRVEGKDIKLDQFGDLIAQKVIAEWNKRA